MCSVFTEPTVVSLGQGHSEARSPGLRGVGVGWVHSGMRRRGLCGKPTQVLKRKIVNRC